MGYEIGDTFETRHGKMTVVDSLRIQGKNGVLRKYYMLRCEKGHQYPVGESYLKAGRLVTCKKCNHPTIAERDPEFAKWFVDSSIPWEKSPYTHLKADFYCPECGKIVKGKNINNVYQRRRVQCPYCGDGISYPERYIHALLTQMQIPFVRQYTVKFQENGRKTHYKYDFYDQERNIFIETHGTQHFVPHVFERVGRASLEKIQQRDHEKRRMAVEQLGIGYIDLDCRKSDPDWMKAEVMKKLSFYPLETVDWKRVQRETNSSITLQLIALCQQGYTQKQAGEIVHLHQGTVCQ